MFVLGGDADDVRTVRETARFSVEKGIDTVQFLPLTPLPGTRQADQLRREGRLFLTLNPATGRYELDYGVGNSVLIRTRNINPLDLQRELLAAYEKFYSMKNIVSSVARGATAQTVVAKLVGRHLVRSGRGQVNEHMEWMRRHSFTKDWEEFVRSGQARSGVPALQV